MNIEVDSKLVERTRRVRMNLPRLASCQIRGARSMMGYTIARLAEESGVSSSSIRRAESGFGQPNVTLDLLDRLHRFFDSRGFVFAWKNGSPCVTWNGYPGSNRQPNDIDPAGPF